MKLGLGIGVALSAGRIPVGYSITITEGGTTYFLTLGGNILTIN